MAYSNPIDTRTEAFRNETKQRLGEALRQANTNFVQSIDMIEDKVYKQTKNREDYLHLIKRVMAKAHQTAQQKAACMAQQQQQAHLQQQQLQQQQIQQQQSQMQQQQQQQAQIMFSGVSTAGQQPASAGSMFGKVQTSVQQNAVIQQTANPILHQQQNSPGQAMQIRPAQQVIHSSTSLPRAMAGTAPSPQSSMVGSYQPRPQQWSQPSPGSQFSGGRFAQPKPPLQTTAQPVLTMPDSAGTPHPSAIPSLSPAHQSPQIGTSSPSLRTPGSIQPAPSPGQLSIATVPSPASVGQNQADDDKEYMEKLKQLQKYIEPLSRMINKFNEDEEHNKDLSKMKNLRDTLINPSKRLHMKTLEKCEKVLQNWLDQKPSQPPPFPQQQPNQHMCQPILNVIATASKSPLLNHTLKRTFGPAMRTMCGDYSTPAYLPSKRQCIRKSVKEMEKRKANQLMPSIIQGEIARLNSKFNIKLDKSCPDNENFRILCFLDDPRLPSVPPLQLSVPKSYPSDCPQWIKTPVFVPDNVNAADLFSTTNQDGKQQTFEKLLQPILHERMTSLNGSSCTISSLVNAWEVSVRQACSSIA